MSGSDSIFVCANLADMSEHYLDDMPSPYLYYLPPEIISAIAHDRSEHPIVDEYHDRLRARVPELSAACWRYCFGELPEGDNVRRARDALHYYNLPGVRAGALFIKRKEPTT